MNEREERIFDNFKKALIHANCNETPYRHWLVSNVFPDGVLADVNALRFPIGDLGGKSGKRELHNDTRHYFDQANIEKYDVIASIANTFQRSTTIDMIEKFFNISLDETFLRIEYAQDITGFWLEPHTDLGVKRLTVLIYLSDEPDHDSLGTDIYDVDRQWVARTPFAPNRAMAFVPSDHTYHGFEKRRINGVRRSLILNYVTKEWRDREQLCFPHQTVSANELNGRKDAV